MYVILAVIFLTLVYILTVLYHKNKINQKIEEDYNKLQKAYSQKTNELNEARKIAKIGIWTRYHKQDDKLVFNEETYKIFDLDHETTILTLDDYFSAILIDDREKVKSAFLNHLKTKESYFITYKLMTVKNELKYVKEWCKTDFDADGIPEVSHGIIQDIPQTRAKELLVQKQNQEMIEQSKIAQEKLNANLALFGANVIASDANLDGNITYASQALCEISGYSQEELLGKPHSILRHPSTNALVFKEMWETIQNGKVWRGEFKNLKKDGDYYWVRTKVEPKFNKNKDIIAYSSIRVDITPEKAKEQFLANMSHELRTPLNAILGFIEIIKKETQEKETLEYASIIENSGLGLLKIIEDVLDFSKIQSGQIDIEMIEFDVYEACQFLQSMFNIKAQEKGIRLQVNIDKNTPKYLKSDPFRLRQIIFNLVSNALKFTQEDRTIFVNIHYADGELFISVKDEGKGITPEKLSIIFEEFTQENVSTTREFGGTGLGLTISQKLANLLGGDITVTSEPGVGSEFMLHVPVEVVEKLHKELKAIEKRDFSTLRILLVEDNPANQMFMKILFKKMHISFDICSDGLEAVELFDTIEANRYDLILMDENMPNMNGTQATQEILQIEEKKNLKHTPIIALTSNAFKDDREKFLSAGMDEYLTKPINQKKLEEALLDFI